MIGIIGGMGPRASAKILEEIIKYSNQKYKATKESDYPPIILYNLPIKGSDETGFRNKKIAKQKLKKIVNKLSLADCDIIIMACNSAHYFYDYLQSSTSKSMISIVNEVKKEVLSRRLGTVGLLATNTTINSKLYHNKFLDSQIQIILPNKNEQRIITNIIYKIENFKEIKKDFLSLMNISKRLKDRGAEGVIIGCTELPILFEKYQKNYGKYFISSSRVLSRSVVDYHFKK